MNPRSGSLRQLLVALRVMIVLTVLVGVAYPAAVTAVGALALPRQAAGSPVSVDGTVVGSTLIGQSFADDAGNALPEWFQSRPSAGAYDGRASGGSNLGPNSPALVDSVAGHAAAVGTGGAVPADALTASASGLDPHISPAYARLQVARVAEARGLREADVAALVESKMNGRDLGFLGEPTVNVLELNIALATLDTDEGD